MSSIYYTVHSASALAENRLTC